MPNAHQDMLIIFNHINILSLLITMPINIDQCQPMLMNISQYFSIKSNANQYLLTLIDIGSLLVGIQINCRIFIGIDW